MEPELMERIKSALEGYEPHFERLLAIAQTCEVFDEERSGFYGEDEALAVSRWEKVTLKIAQGLDEGIEGCTITRGDAQRPDLCRMILHVRPQEAEQPATLQIDYGSEGQLLLQLL